MDQPDDVVTTTKSRFQAVTPWLVVGALILGTVSVFGNLLPGLGAVMSGPAAGLCVIAAIMIAVVVIVLMVSPKGKRRPRRVIGITIAAGLFVYFLIASGKFANNLGSPDGSWGVVGMVLSGLIFTGALIAVLAIIGVILYFSLREPNS